MILNCPACSAKFMVSAEALGPNGRDVRCGKCGHTWFQAGAHDSLDELQKLVDKIDEAEDESAYSPDHGQSSSRGDIKLNASPKDILDKATPKQKPIAAKNSRASGFKFSPASLFSVDGQKILAGFVAALAFVMVLALIIVSIARPFYAPKVSQIMIDKVKTELSDAGLDGSFRLVNLSAEPQLIPPFKLVLMTDSGRIVSTQIVKSKSLEIEAEATSTIKFHFDDAPSVATKLNIISE